MKQYSNTEGELKTNVAYKRNAQFITGCDLRTENLKTRTLKTETSKVGTLKVGTYRTGTLKTKNLKTGTQKNLDPGCHYQIILYCYVETSSSGNTVTITIYVKLEILNNQGKFLVSFQNKNCPLPPRTKFNFYLTLENTMKKQRHFDTKYCKTADSTNSALTKYTTCYVTFT